MSVKSISLVPRKPTSVFAPAPLNLLQRKCACGNSAGVAGQCSECSNGKLTGHTPPFIQPKLKIGQPNDKYEQEADRVADMVMRMPAPAIKRQAMDEDEDEELLQTKRPANQITQLVQRETMVEEEDEDEQEALQRKTAMEEQDEEEMLQTKGVTPQAPTVTHSTEAAIRSVRQGGGQPLDYHTRAFMESRFGHDFSQVRVHTDLRAKSAARSVNARAFTVGYNIFFNSGESWHNATNGQRILAHELTHVIQQTRDNTRLHRSQRANASHRNVDAGIAGGSDSGDSPSCQPMLVTSPTVMRLSEERFRKRVGRTPDQKAVINLLFNHPKFQELWDWLGNCQGKRADHGPIKLRVGRIFEAGVETFGEFDQGRGILRINPMILEAKKNPQELGDTIVHELIHAISWASRKQLCPDPQRPGQQLTPPLLDLDIISSKKNETPKILELENTENFEKAELESFELYGPSSSDPCSGFMDIRAQPQEKIIEIIDDIHRQSRIGGPTRTKVNVILREEIRRAGERSSKPEEILDASPLLRGFRKCRDEECKKRPRKRDFAHCFDQVIFPEA